MFEKYNDSDDVYIIAEVGQNHQGDLPTAKKYVEEFTRLAQTQLSSKCATTNTSFQKKLLIGHMTKKIHSGNPMVNTEIT